MKKFLELAMAAAAALALLAPAAASAAASNSCPCPCNSVTSTELSTQSGWADPVFYRPFVAMQEEMDRLNQDMNRLMQEAFYVPGNQNFAHEQLYSRINMETTPEEYRITMTAPGLNEKDLKVDVGADNTLTIRSEKNLVQKTGDETERSFGSFTQMLTLPPDADAAHVETSFKNGQYTVTLPRKDGASSAGQTEGHDRSL